MFDEIKNLIFSRTAKDTYVVFAGNIVSFLFGIIFVVFAARAIEPSGWGIFSAAGGLLIILFAFSEFGLSSGLFRFVSSLWQKGKVKEVREVASVILMARILISLTFAMFMFAFAESLSEYLFKSDDKSLIYFTAAGLVGALLSDFQISLAQAKRRWLASSILLSLTNFFRLIFLIIANYLGKFNLSILFAVFFLSPLVTFLVSMLIEMPKLMFSVKSFSILKRVSKFSLWMGLNGSVNSISARVDSILLLQLAGSFEAGIVGAARQLGNSVLILLGSFATVIAPRLASYEGSALKKYYRKTAMFSILLTLGILVGTILVGPIISLFGAKYVLSAGILKWLLIALIPSALSTPSVNALIYAFKKPKVIAVLSVIQLPLIVLGNIILIPRIGIYGPIVIIALWNLSTFIVSTIKTKWELSHIH